MNVQAILCHERGSSEYLISLKSSELKIVYYKKWTEYTYFRCRKPKEKTASKIASGSILCIETGTWMSVYFFIPKKILGGKHQSKKFRLQICNLVNINKKVWSLLIGKSMCMVIIPCMKKYLTGPLFTYIHQYWSAAMWEKMFCFDEKIVFWSKIL